MVELQGRMCCFGTRAGYLINPVWVLNKPGPGIFSNFGYRTIQLVNVGSPPRTGATRPLGSSQSSWRPSAVMSR